MNKVRSYVAHVLSEAPSNIRPFLPDDIVFLLLAKRKGAFSLKQQRWTVRMLLHVSKRIREISSARWNDNTSDKIRDPRHMSRVSVSGVRRGHSDNGWLRDDMRN